MWEDTNFTDVTLATSDGQQLRAHKVVLASNSPFFKQLLLANPHPSPLVYLRGLAFREVEQVLRMLYLGEVEVLEEQVEPFLGVARDLGITNHIQENNQEDMFEKIEDNTNRPHVFKVEYGVLERASSGLLAFKTSNESSPTEKTPKVPGENNDSNTMKKPKSPLSFKANNEQHNIAHSSHGETEEITENATRLKPVEYGDDPFFICDVCN